MYRTFKGGSSLVRDTYFVYEDGSWKHQLTDEELALFMAASPFEELVKPQEGDSTENEASEREEVTPTEREEKNTPEEQDAKPASSTQPQRQTTDPEGPYYHPPQGPCLGQCTDAYGRSSADLQSEWARMSPEEKADERERNIAARQGGG